MNIEEIPAEIVMELIDHSYELVVQGLKKKDREELQRKSI